MNKEIEAKNPKTVLWIAEKVYSFYICIDLQNMFACECCSQWMKHAQKWFYAAGPIIALLRW